LPVAPPLYALWKDFPTGVVRPRFNSLRRR